MFVWRPNTPTSILPVILEAKPSGMLKGISLVGGKGVPEGKACHLLTAVLVQGVLYARLFSVESGSVERSVRLAGESNGRRRGPRARIGETGRGLYAARMMEARGR